MSMQFNGETPSHFVVWLYDDGATGYMFGGSRGLCQSYIRRRKANDLDVTKCYVIRNNERGALFLKNKLKSRPTG